MDHSKRTALLIATGLGAALLGSALTVAAVHAKPALGSAAPTATTTIPP